jgi:hypothetical protein
LLEIDAAKPTLRNSHESFLSMPVYRPLNVLSNAMIQRTWLMQISGFLLFFRGFSPISGGLFHMVLFQNGTI